MVGLRQLTMTVAGRGRSVGPMAARDSTHSRYTEVSDHVNPVTDFSGARRPGRVPRRQVPASPWRSGSGSRLDRVRGKGERPTTTSLASAARPISCSDVAATGYRGVAAGLGGSQILVLDGSPDRPLRFDPDGDDLRPKASRG